MSRAQRSLGLVLVLAIATGCSLSLDRGALVPAGYDLKARHKEAVSILVAGGKESDAWEGVFISNEDFTTALGEAVTKSGLFSGVAASGAPFRLEVLLQRLSRPGAGLGMESQLGALWVLKSTEPDRVVWQDLLVTTGSASVGDAFSGFTRGKTAIERAASNNIRRGIEEISLLNLDAPAPR